MALNGTYAGLQASVADWLNRTDLTAQIPDFISLTEAKMNRTLRLRVREGDQSLATVVGSRFVALPAAFDEALQLWIEWSWGREEVGPVIASEMVTNASKGRPYYWAVDNGNIAFERASDQVYNLTLRCLSSFSLAASSAPALFVLANFPDLYLYGALLEAAPFLRDDDRVSLWTAKYKTALDEVQAHESRSRSLGPLKVDPGLRQARRFNIYSGDFA